MKSYSLLAIALLLTTPASATVFVPESSYDGTVPVYASDADTMQVLVDGNVRYTGPPDRAVIRAESGFHEYLVTAYKGNASTVTEGAIYVQDLFGVVARLQANLTSYQQQSNLFNLSARLDALEDALASQRLLLEETKEGVGGIEIPTDVAREASLAGLVQGSDFQSYRSEQASMGQAQADAMGALREDVDSMGWILGLTVVAATLSLVATGLAFMWFRRRAVVSDELVAMNAAMAERVGITPDSPEYTRAREALRPKFFPELRSRRVAAEAPIVAQAVEVQQDVAEELLEPEGEGAVVMVLDEALDDGLDEAEEEPGDQEVLTPEDLPTGALMELLKARDSEAVAASG